MPSTTGIPRGNSAIPLWSCRLTELHGNEICTACICFQVQLPRAVLFEELQGPHGQVPRRKHLVKPCTSTDPAKVRAYRTRGSLPQPGSFGHRGLCLSSSKRGRSTLFRLFPCCMKVCNTCHCCRCLVQPCFSSRFLLALLKVLRGTYHYEPAGEVKVDAPGRMVAERDRTHH